jgi:hypothetical protein
VDVTLPDGTVAVLRSNEEITERVFRPIDRAKTKVMNLSARMLERGYDPPETWAELSPEETESRNLRNLAVATDLSDEDQDVMEDYQMALVLGITKSWSKEAEITKDSVLDLPKASFEALAAFCLTSFDGTELDLEPAPNQTALVQDSPN